MMHDLRKAARIQLDSQAIAVSIGQPQSAIPPKHVVHYSKVIADIQHLQEKRTGKISDLSANGAFIAGDPFPILSRIGVGFTFQERTINAIGWVLWTRNQELSHPKTGMALPAGMGILFEFIPFHDRHFIYETISQSAEQAE